MQLFKIVEVIPEFGTSEEDRDKDMSAIDVFNFWGLVVNIKNCSLFVLDT